MNDTYMLPEGWSVHGVFKHAESKFHTHFNNLMMMNYYEYSWAGIGIYITDFCDSG